jgi:hypothetical protein
MLLPHSPTAHGLTVGVACTPKRALLAPGLFGLFIIDHLWPFQCISMAVPSKIEKKFWAAPTIHALVGDVTVTDSSELMSFFGSRFGVGTRFQVWPFQCRASERPLESVPTAQAFDGELALTSPSALSAGPAVAVCQAWPFQRRIWLVEGTDLVNPQLPRWSWRRLRLGHRVRC